MNVFDLSRNFFLLKAVYHLRRLRALTARHDAAVDSAERLRGEFYEQLWEAAAAEAGAQFKRLGNGICAISRNGLTTRVQQNCTAIDDPVTHTIALNKTLVNRLLSEAGLPVPRHVEFTLRTLSRATAFLKQTGGECVVKPASGTGGGQGVTTGIRTPRQLAWAATEAAQACGEMLLEEQIMGDNYRLLYLDGVLLDAVLRCPPAVTGDGRTTIRDLIAAVNEERLGRGSTISPILISIDMDMQHTLARQGLTLSSVPAPGVVVPVKTVINQNIAADNITVTGQLCRSVVADGARAANAVGVRLAGIDVITRDPSAPLAECGGVILEVNTTPGFHYHYHKSDGSFPVADYVLDRLLNELEERAALRVAALPV